MKHGKVFQQNSEILSWKIFTAFYGFTPNNFTAETCLKLLKFFKCLAFVDLLIKKDEKFPQFPLRIMKDYVNFMTNQPFYT